MNKLIAVALLAVPLTFAQNSTGTAQTGNTDTAKTQKHSKKHSKKAKADNTTATPASK